MNGIPEAKTSEGAPSANRSIGIEKEKKIPNGFC